MSLKGRLWQNTKVKPPIKLLKHLALCRRKTIWCSRMSANINIQIFPLILNRFSGNVYCMIYCQAWKKACWNESFHTAWWCHHPVGQHYIHNTWFTVVFSPCFPPLMAFGTRVKRSNSVSVRAHPGACFLCHLHGLRCIIRLATFAFRSSMKIRFAVSMANSCHGDRFFPPELWISAALPKSTWASWLLLWLILSFLGLSDAFLGIHGFVRLCL